MAHGDDAADVTIGQPRFETATPYLRDIAADMTTPPGVTRTQLEVSDAALIDLRRRLESVRWPDRETASGAAQGVTLERAQRLLHHWRHTYDWRRFEATVNRLGHYRTRIDGLDIHFLHVRSRHDDALPVILTHGWPGSFVEFLPALGPLTDPTAHGGAAQDAFHVVVPSLPGFGFTGKPTEQGWTVERIAAAWAHLMQSLGYRRYIGQGGDWGGAVTHTLGALAPKGLAGIHLNFPPFVFSPPLDGAPSADEQHALHQIAVFRDHGAGYHLLQSTRPQTIGYSLADSPAGLAMWMFEKFDAWTDSGHHADTVIPTDVMLDNITLYWLTNTGASSARIYWQHHGVDVGSTAPNVPVGISAFPGEIVRIPHLWAQRAYPSLVYFNAVARGGHFAALEQPELFTAELRAFGRALNGSRPST
jgi:pimeloyl-ACP methyl ester carboxylesterase